MNTLFKVKKKYGVCELCKDKRDPGPLEPILYKGKIYETCEMCIEGIKIEDEKNKMQNL